MILTFELDKDGESLAIFFDKEGRDYLLASLSGIDEWPDHDHLFMQPIGDLSAKRFSADSKALHSVSLGMLKPDREPVGLETIEYSKMIDGKIVKFRQIGDEVQVIDSDESNKGDSAG